jgi:hypothetical protein
MYKGLAQLSMSLANAAADHPTGPVEISSNLQGK